MVTPRIGIITALPKECWAMRAFLESWKEVYVDGRGAGRRYYVGTNPARDGGSHTVALCHSGVGNNNAAIRASLMLQHFQSVKVAIMVGIAGGVPNPAKVDEHVRLGDIVVSSEGGVTQYDLGKEIATIVEGESIVEFTEKNPPRVSSYLALVQEGSEQDLHYIDEMVETENVIAVFLPHMQTLVQAVVKRRREELTKNEEELLCKSSPKVVFNDLN